MEKICDKDKVEVSISVLSRFCSSLARILQKLQQIWNLFEI